MQRVSVRLTARAYVISVTAVGLAVVGVAVAHAADASLAALALFGAAVIVAELFQVPSDDESLDPVDAQSFSFSSGVHVAAVLVLGPAAAALVAAFGVLTVDRLRGGRWRHVLFNAAAFALAAAAAGGAYELAGGTPGRLSLPSDLVALAVLLCVYRMINLGLVSGAVAVSSGIAFWPHFLDELRMEVGAAAAEAGLGVALALAALENPWRLLALAPLALAVYQAHAHLTQLRRETLRALETFANVVDERDPSTYRHSERVAEHVRQLAESLALPAAQVARLRLAARLHDLGKIAVDSSILGKPDRLDEREWAVLRRHPRLSARLLRRFRFAAVEARLVEYHHERYDGTGYYGIGREQVPLGAHFLVVADSYDAMTSDRSYRTGLGREEALARIEEGSGTQFHPLVAKAFVAVEQGRALEQALTRDELRELRRVAQRRARPSAVALRSIDPAVTLAFGGILGALLSVGVGHPLVASIGAALALTGLAGRVIEHVRTRRLAAGLRRALSRPVSREAHFEGLVGRLAAAGLRWAGLVSWNASELSGSLMLESSEGATGPSNTALVSWLMRDIEARDGMIVVEGAELGRDGTYVALPLRCGEAVGAYLALAFEHAPSRTVASALRVCCGEVASALAVEPPPPVRPQRLAAVS